MVLALAACGGNGDKDGEKMKVGFIYLHDENSTYDKNFIDAAKAACDKLGVEYIEKKNIPESNECKEAALDLVDRGCSIVFADSFGHERAISPRLLLSIPRFSSAMPQVQQLTHLSLTISTMLSLPSTRVAISQALPQA